MSDLLRGLLGLVWMLVAHKARDVITRPVLRVSMSGVKKILQGRETIIWPLTAVSRVNHLLCDSDERLDDEISTSAFYALMLLPISIWTLTWPASGELQHPIIARIATFASPSCAAWSFGQSVRCAIRHIHRTALQEQLRQERSRWDPAAANPRLFVSRRDTKPEAVMLFDRIT